MSSPTAILIGTASGVASLRCQLAFLSGRDHVSGAPGGRVGSGGGGGVWPCGCVLLGDEPPERAGLEVLGTLDQMAELVSWHRPDMAIVTIPRRLERDRRRVVEALSRAGLEARFVPAIEDVVAGEPERVRPAGHGAEIDVARLIGRTTRPGDPARLDAVLRSKRVLITGAGGSIGSELARIAASRSPAELILVERSENALFEIDREMRERFPGVNRRAVLHDIVDAERTGELFRELTPDVVFHAAAHKHVPLMEDHPAHAVTNNFFGTKSVADASVEAGVSRFVLISSDKAVNPTSVMGATKRLAERYIQGLQSHSERTRFSMVRFGNVLGSACSVLPIWSSQLAAGRPITVTDARMTRYFMTIPEAASLVIQSASLESGAGDPARVFVLDMGEPVSIAKLARSFARAHGYDPDEAITFIGARPGEKLYEELAYNAEMLAETGIAGVRSWTAEAMVALDLETMVRDLDEARSGGVRASKSAALEAIRRHVPEMSPASGPVPRAVAREGSPAQAHQTVRSVAPIENDVAA